MDKFSFKRVLAQTLLASLVLASGCAHRYLMKLSDGNQIISISKPKLQGTNYHFRDQDGEECAIPKSRVTKIETGAVPAEEKHTSPPAPAGPKKAKHWYFLWLN